MIPSSLVKRAEVLTGGASSIYGADAVAGVVNFIMDTEFTGIRFDGQYSFYQHNNNARHHAMHAGNVLRQRCDMRQIDNRLDWLRLSARGSVVDGGTFDGTVSIGADFDDDRGHAVAYFGYRKVNPVTAGPSRFQRLRPSERGRQANAVCGRFGRRCGRTAMRCLFSHVSTATSTVTP